MLRKLIAEFIGTFWLVLGGCGSAVLAASFPEVGIGLTNIDRRVKLLFGEQYGIRIQVAPGVGTSVALHLPYRTRTH